MSGVGPDARLSNYRIDRLLGSGGMGSVYLAQDLTLGRAVAIKFISPDKAGDIQAHRRLIREARAAAALDHPNICAVHEVIVEESGRACIVMQYVEGETLADRLKSGPLEPRLAVTVTSDIAEALAAAHKREIIHRDVKPQNVIVTADRRAKLLDFGIARMTEVTPSGDKTATDLTVAGVLIGTPPYMSPEQAQQLPVDRRSDLFSLGAVLFECLTGRRAFQAASTLELLTQILTYHPPPVSSLRPELTDRYDEVCRRLLAKHPDDRFRSAEELLGALRLLAADTSRSAVLVDPLPAPSRWHRRPAFLTAVAALVVVAAVGTWRWRADPPEPADELYRLGTDYIRSGAYDSGRRALLEVAKRSPSAAVYVRLAEANTELDEIELAKDNVLKAGGLPASREDTLRARAVRALALREVDEAVRAYRELTEIRPSNASAWFDLGRAQDAAALAADARLSYDKAIANDDQYAAAYLRRASLLALEGDRDRAMQDFARADQIYELRSNVEGRAEVLLRRGGYLDAIGMLDQARVDLERARTIGTASKSQQLRAQLLLSSVTLSQGNVTLALETAQAAVDAARGGDLDATAADGLVEMASALQRGKHYQQADERLLTALDIARKRGALRVIARATVQRASVLIENDHVLDGVKLAADTLPMLRKARYRRYELKALNVIARGRETLGQFAEAQANAAEVLRLATELHDDAQVGEAIESLAGQANALGNLPEALTYRLQGENIHRAQKDLGTLAYDLTNRADLLIRLGRPEEAAKLLAEVDDGVAKGIDAFKNRLRRAMSLRATTACVQADYATCSRIAAEVKAADATDTSGRVAARLLEYSTAAGGRRITPAPFTPSDTIASAVGREIRYWALAAHLATGDAPRTMGAVSATLRDPNAAVSPEFEWRVAAIGAAAALRTGAADASTFAERAQKALDRLRDSWKSETASYLARPDLKDLLRKAGLNTRS
jgi:tetratricopeptide (TPR) repeat protein